MRYVIARIINHFDWDTQTASREVEICGYAETATAAKRTATTWCKQNRWNAGWWNTPDVFFTETIKRDGANARPVYSKGPRGWKLNHDMLKDWSAD